MECEKCGASIPEGAETCPECGEPVAAAAETDTEFGWADETPADEAPAAPVEAPVPVTDATPAPSAPQAGGRRGLMIVLAVVLVALLAGGGYLIYARVAEANSPAGVAKAMLNAYADYDAQGILDTATHSSLAASDVVTFENQAKAAKTEAKGAPSIKNIKIGTVTMTGTDKATVEITADWLDSTTGKYASRTEKLVLVKQNGKWLVQLF